MKTGQQVTLKGFSKVPLEFGMIPAGALYSSVEDMAKFIQFHLNYGVVGNKKILEKKYLEEMYSVPFPVKGQIEGYALGIDKDEKIMVLIILPIAEAEWVLRLI